MAFVGRRDLSVSRMRQLLKFRSRKLTFFYFVRLSPGFVFKFQGPTGGNVLGKFHSVAVN